MDLKVRRIRARITQQQVAERVGLSRSWVAKIERQDKVAVDVIGKYVTALDALQGEAR